MVIISSNEEVHCNFPLLFSFFLRDWDGGWISIGDLQGEVILLVTRFSFWFNFVVSISLFDKPILV